MKNKRSWIERRRSAPSGYALYSTFSTLLLITTESLLGFKSLNARKSFFSQEREERRKNKQKDRRFLKEWNQTRSRLAKEENEILAYDANLNCALLWRVFLMHAGE